MTHALIDTRIDENIGVSTISAHARHLSIDHRSLYHFIIISILSTTISLIRPVRNVTTCSFQYFVFRKKKRDLLVAQCFVTKFSAGSGSETNGLGEETVAVSDYLPSETQHSGPYLVGPMVIRVYPDGRPVPEDQKHPLPKDEDADELRYSRLPSIEEIEANSGSVFYGKGAVRSAERSPSAFKGVRVDSKDRRRQEELAMRSRDNPLPYERRVMPQSAANERTRMHYFW